MVTRTRKGDRGPRRRTFTTARMTETYGSERPTPYSGPDIHDLFPEARVAHATRGVTPIREDQGNAFTLIGLVPEDAEMNLNSGYYEAQYSANPHDYFMAPDTHIFEENGTYLDLAWMGYDRDGRYRIWKVIKEGPVTVADLKRLPVK